MYTYVNILHSVNKELNWIELNWKGGAGGALQKKTLPRMQEPAHGLLTDDTPRDPDLIILV